MIPRRPRKLKDELSWVQGHEADLHIRKPMGGSSADDVDNALERNIELRKDARDLIEVGSQKRSVRSPLPRNDRCTIGSYRNCAHARSGKPAGATNGRSVSLKDS